MAAMFIPRDKKESFKASAERTGAEAKREMVVREQSIIQLQAKLQKSITSVF